MKKIKFTPVVLIVLALALAMAAGGTYAKYATTKTVGGTLTVTANLGSIAMDENIITKSIIPGVDVSVDHKVLVTEKTSIPAYVYLVLDINIADNTLEFHPSDEWEKIFETTTDDIKTIVYVYADGTNPIEVKDDVTIPVNGTLVVSQYFNTSNKINLKFSAKMYQTAAGNTAEEVYKSFNPPQLS
jgi:type 1 fimbria pilin